MEFTASHAISASRKYSRRKPNVPRAWFRTLTGMPVNGYVPLLGTLDPYIDYIFSNGQCHAMALALHEILGWPIFGVYSSVYNGGDGDRRTRHFVVMAPSKLTGDVGGLQCIMQCYRTVKPEVILKGRMQSFFEPAMDVARHYAPMVVEQRIAAGWKHRDGKSWYCPLKPEDAAFFESRKHNV